MLTAGLTGFATGFSLILAIGAQNAFVLKQGLLRSYVLPIVLLCAVSDALMITLGVAGFAVITERAAWLIPVLTYGGAAFLIWYGWISFRSAMTERSLEAASRGASSLRNALLSCLAFTWLNPHFYLDTVALIGAISAPYQGDDKWAFGIGAVASSGVFFFMLGYGARLLTPLFARPAAWRVLDVLIGAVMWAIAAKLLFG